MALDRERFSNCEIGRKRGRSEAAMRQAKKAALARGTVVTP